MTNLKKFMVVHKNPGVDCSVVQSNWRKLAKVENATWVRSYFNEEKGTRFCLWLSPNEEELDKIFKAMDVSFESIIPVVETVPDLWGEKWQDHLKKDEVVDNLGN